MQSSVFIGEPEFIRDSGGIARDWLVSRICHGLGFGVLGLGLHWLRLESEVPRLQLRLAVGFRV